jgi:hypothetical protein
MKYEKDWKDIFDAKITEHLWVAPAPPPADETLPAEHDPARAPHAKFASLWCDACPRPASSTTNVREAFEKWYAVYKDITLYIDGMQDAFEAGYNARSKERDAQAAAPGGKDPLSLYKACETIAEKEIEKWGWHSDGARAAHNIWSEIRTLAASEAAAPGGKEPSGSNSPKYMQMGSITSVVDPQHRTMVAGFPPPPNIIEIPEYLDKVAKEIAEEFCGGSEAVEDAILAKLLATHPSQDKPPAAPLCGKRIPETGLGCTLEPGHQGRHDVDVTKVSEAPLRKRLEGVLPSIAIRIHAYMSAAQSLPYEEGETCEECEDIARELIELDGEPPNEAGQVISQEPIKIELRSLEEATESVSKWPAWKREYSEQHPFLTSQDPKSESTMSMQKACETIAEKEIKKWYSHSEGARAAHNIWSKIRALAARPKEEPK